MIDHEVRTYPSSARLAREEQLAWKLAAVATDPVEVTAEVTEMVVNRVIDDAAVAAASLARRPVRAAREQALRHPAAPGAAVWGADADRRISPENRFAALSPRGHARIACRPVLSWRCIYAWLHRRCRLRRALFR